MFPSPHSQHDADPWVVVGPSRLPAGLPRDTTPDEFRADGDDGSVKATMKRAVKKFGYTIRVRMCPPIELTPGL